MKSLTFSQNMDVVAWLIKKQKLSLFHWTNFSNYISAPLFGNAAFYYYHETNCCRLTAVCDEYKASHHYYYCQTGVLGMDRALAENRRSGVTVTEFRTICRRTYAACCLPIQPSSHTLSFLHDPVANSTEATVDPRRQ